MPRRGAVDARHRPLRRVTRCVARRRTIAEGRPQRARAAHRSPPNWKRSRPVHVTVDPFVPAQAGEQDLMGYYNVTAAVFLEANPDTPLPTFEAVAAVLRAPDEPFMRRRFWIARDDNQRIVGLVIASLPSAENAESVIAQVRVLPAARRRGVGVALLRAMLSDATLTAGRSRLVGSDVVGGSEGDRWAAGLGFKRTQERVLQVLPVSELDLARWDGPSPDGFTLEVWAGAAPEHLVADYALARSAMADAPVGRSSLRAPEWTVERVRERERFERESGRDLWVVAALDVASGRIVGLRR